jgi:hypothetical protein
MEPKTNVVVTLTTPKVSSLYVTPSPHSLTSRVSTPTRTTSSKDNDDPTYMVHLPQEEEDAPVITLHSFNSQLKSFKFLLLISGLHVKSSFIYKWFLRCITWSCAVLCVLNTGFHTRAYRNLLFDLCLSLMHVWVVVAYEHWRKYLKKDSWKTLVFTQPSIRFFRRLQYIGYIGLIGIFAASIFITIGWLSPILMTFFHKEEDNLIFLGFHGLLMIIIVVPWACVCLTSMFLFYILIEAHKADMEAYCRKLASMALDPQVTLCRAYYP